MIFQIAEDFFRDITHHVGFPLGLSLIYYAYMVIIPLCTQLNLIKKPPIKWSSSIKRPVINAPKIIAEKNGKLNLC